MHTQSEAYNKGVDAYITMVNSKDFTNIVNPYLVDTQDYRDFECGWMDAYYDFNND